MDCTEPEILDRRLGNQQYIVHPADVNYFDNLTMRVRTLMRGTDKFELPDINGAYAWRRLYATYVALKKRESSERAERADRQETRVVGSFASDNLAWNEYVQNLAALQDYARRESGHWSLMSEYLDLEADDLGDPVPPVDSPYGIYGRYPNWQRRASRVSWALARLRNMGRPERARVGEVVYQRRQEARMKTLEQRLAAIESSPATQKEDVENGQ